MQIGQVVLVQWYFKELNLFLFIEKYNILYSKKCTEKDQALKYKWYILKGQNKEVHRFSLGQKTENSSVNPFVALWYILTLIPMGQHPEIQNLFPIDIMLNTTI